jgi:hypothetical protein
MKFDKIQIKRAVEEISECFTNILRSERDQYALRIKQLIKKVNDNEILNYLIIPYLNLKLDEERIGFIKTGHHIKSNFIIPEDEDEEIALILKVLENMANNENTIDGETLSIYMKDSYDENLFLFKKNIIEPAFNKLYRKLQYKLEDISTKNGEKVEAGDITIINIKEFNAENSMVAIGKKITQHNDNIFERIKNELLNNIDNEKDKLELLSYISEMEKNKANKKVFKMYYDKFISKLGIYMSIIGPLLPFLVDYFK